MPRMPGPGFWLKLAGLLVVVLLVRHLLWRRGPGERDRDDDVFVFDWINDTLPATGLKKVVLWTGYYSAESWISFLRNFDKNPVCPGICKFTDDRSNESLSTAHAVLFHSSAKNLDLNALPSLRHPEQSYVFFTQEPPPKAGYQDRPHLWHSFPTRFFNLTMTYRLDSDVPVPYDGFELPSDDADDRYSWDKVMRIVQSKNRTALQLVGNCYSESGREGVVRRLARRLSVDRFGYCAGRECDKTCEASILPLYYFYLAFENNVCGEYVTEKFWRLRRLVVPVVLRRSIAASVAPADAFIAVDDFDSVEALADHLQYLTTNHTAYANYFRWTRQFRKTERPWQSAYCRLCHRLQEPVRHKSYRDIHAWYWPQGICEVVPLNWLVEGAIFWHRLVFTIVVACVLLLTGIVVGVWLRWRRGRTKTYSLVRP